MGAVGVRCSRWTSLSFHCSCGCGPRCRRAARRGRAGRARPCAARGSYSSAPGTGPTVAGTPPPGRARAAFARRTERELVGARPAQLVEQREREVQARGAAGEVALRERERGLLALLDLGADRLQQLLLLGGGGLRLVEDGPREAQRSLLALDGGVQDGHGRVPAGLLDLGGGRGGAGHELVGRHPSVLSGDWGRAFP